MISPLDLVVEVLVPGLELLVVQRLHVEVGPLQLLLKHIDLVHPKGGIKVVNKLYD